MADAMVPIGQRALTTRPVSGYEFLLRGTRSEVEALIRDAILGFGFEPTLTATSWKSKGLGWGTRVIGTAIVRQETAASVTLRFTTRVSSSWALVAPLAIFIASIWIVVVTGRPSDYVALGFLPVAFGVFAAIAAKIYRRRRIVIEKLLLTRVQEVIRDRVIAGAGDVEHMVGQLALVQSTSRGGEVSQAQDEGALSKPE